MHNTKLESLFDLPQSVEEEKVEDSISNIEIDDTICADSNSIMERIDKSLPLVKGLTSSDVEMDELAKLAIDSYTELMSLGMNVEARFSSEIFSTAGQMLGHAITAKTAKVNKKLKMLDLQLKKAKLDNDGQNAINGVGVSLDRNELLAELLASQKS